MPNLPPYLRRLEKLLLELPDDDEQMLLSGLDGFLAGILVCPDLIMPGEWLPMVWGGGDEDGKPVLENTRQAEQLVGLVMEHYSALSRSLQNGRHTPVYDVDTQNDEILWGTWIDGFEQAMALRPESWARLSDSRDGASDALAVLIALATISQGDSGLPDAEIDKLTEQAPDLIPQCVQVLNVSRLERDMAVRNEIQKHSMGKVGRNEPCPCGSGKKYKRCCGG